MHIYNVMSAYNDGVSFFVRATFSHDAVNKVEQAGYKAGSWEIPHSIPSWVLSADLSKPVKAVWSRELKALIPSPI